MKMIEIPLYLYAGFIIGSFGDTDNIAKQIWTLNIGLIVIGYLLIKIYLQNKK